MTIAIKHAFNSGKADGPDPTLIQPSNWNASHTINQASGFFLARVSAGPGVTEEVSPAQAQTLLGLASAAYVTASSLATNTQIAAAADAAFVDADFLTAVQTSGGALIKRSWLNTKNALMTAIGPLVAALTQKSPLVLADKILVADSAASNASKYGTLGDVSALVATQIQPPQGYLSGLTLKNNSTTALDLATGIAVDSAGTQGMVLAAGITNKSFSATWVAGSNQGILDTGAVATNTYHVYLIKNLTTGVVDFIASLSASAPTLPTGFTVYRRIGSIIWASAAVTPFVQDGDYFYWNIAFASLAAEFAGNTRAKSALTINVPTGVRVAAILTVSGFANSGSITLDYYDGVNTTIDKQVNFGGSSGANVTETAYVEQFTNTSAQIQLAMSGGGGGAFTTRTVGYRDTRGR